MGEINNSFVHIDGTLFSLRDIQSLVRSASGKNVIVNYFGGHKIVIKYSSTTRCKDVWRLLIKAMGDFISNPCHSRENEPNSEFIVLEKSFFLSYKNIQHVEFDGIDYRIMIRYFNGEQFYIKTPFRTPTKAMFWEIVYLILDGEMPGNFNRYKISRNRERADFWVKVQMNNNIEFVTSDEEYPDHELLKKIDEMKE